MKSTLSIQQGLGSLERLPVHFYPNQNLKMFVFVHADSAIFTFVLDFLAFCFGGGFISLSSPSEIILSITLFLVLKTSTSPVNSSGNHVVFKISSSLFSKSLSCLPVGCPIITTSAYSGSSS